MVSLGTILVNGDATVPRDWASQASTAIDEAVSGTNSDESDHVDAQASTVSSPAPNNNDTAFTLANMPSDFRSMDTATWKIKYRVAGRDAANSDTFGLSLRIVDRSGAVTLAAGSSGGAFDAVDLNINQTGNSPAWLTLGHTAFTYVNTSATKTNWDNAQLEFRQTWTLNGINDNGQVQVASFELSGTYQATASGVGSAAGDSTVTGTLTTQHVTATADGSATFTGAVTGRGSLTATASGDATFTGAVNAQHLIATINGDATVAGLLRGVFSVNAAADGDSTVAGETTAQHLVGSIAGDSAFTGEAFGEVALTGAIAGDSALDGTASAQHLLGDELAGSSTMAGATSPVQISASVAGDSTIAGDLEDLGTSSIHGQIDATSALAGAISGLGALTASSDGLGTALGSLTGVSTLLGQALGVGDLAGLLGPVRLLGAITGSSNLSGSAGEPPIGPIYGQIFGTSTLAGQNRAVGFISRMHRSLMSRFASLSLPAEFTVVFDNVMSAPATDAWVNPYLVLERARIVQFGRQRIIRHTGALECGVYVRRGTARKDAWDVVEMIIEHFHDLTWNAYGDEIRFRHAEARQGGDEAMDQWWHITVRCGFEVDDVFPPKGNSATTTANTYQTALERFTERFVDTVDVQAGHGNFLADPPDTGPFAVLTIETEDQTRSEMTQYRTDGMAFAMLLVPLHTGVMDAYAYADQFYESFKTLRYKGVSFRAPSVSRVGPSGSWWQLTASCPFTSSST